MIGVLGAGSSSRCGYTAGFPRGARWRRTKSCHSKCLLANIPGRGVRHLHVGEHLHRARLPLSYILSPPAFEGGLVGGAAMAVLAVLYGLIGHHSIWYPVNLLAAAGSARISAMSYDQLRLRRHGVVAGNTYSQDRFSALNWICFTFPAPAVAPPDAVGGIFAPLFWSGLLHAGCRSSINLSGSAH